MVENGAYDVTDNPFLAVFHACLEDYILATVELYNSISDKDVADAMAKSRAEEARSLSLPPFNWGRVLYTKGPLMKTEWNQWRPYSDVINSVAGNPLYVKDVSWPTGCVATAMAQIMAHREWPLAPPVLIRKPNNRATILSGFNDPYTVTTTDTKFSDIDFNWGNMTGNPDADYLSNTYKRQIGVLMLAIGDKAIMSYSPTESGSNIEKARDAFEQMGYHRPGITDYNFEVIKASIDQDKPVYVRGGTTNDSSSKGHAWVIDGYRTTYDNQIVSFNPPGVWYVGLTDFVFCNPGWGGVNGKSVSHQENYPINP